MSFWNFFKKKSNEKAVDSSPIVVPPTVTNSDSSNTGQLNESVSDTTNATSTDNGTSSFSGDGGGASGGGDGGGV